MAAPHHVLGFASGLFLLAAAGAALSPSPVAAQSEAGQTPSTPLDSIRAVGPGSDADSLPRRPVPPDSPTRRTSPTPSSGIIPPSSGVRRSAGPRS